MMKRILFIKCGFPLKRIRKKCGGIFEINLIYKCGYLYSRTCKSNAFIYEYGYTNSYICKSFFTLKFELHHTTFIFSSSLCLSFSRFLRSRMLAVHLFFCIFINLFHCEFLESLSSFASSLRIIFFRFPYICFFSLHCGRTVPLAFSSPSLFRHRFRCRCRCWRSPATLHHQRWFTHKVSVLF